MQMGMNFDALNHEKKFAHRCHSSVLSTKCYTTQKLLWIAPLKSCHLWPFVPFVTFRHEILSISDLSRLNLKLQILNFSSWKLSV